MNIPSMYRKATLGFVIPPRSTGQMIFSAAKGAIGLFSEPNRSAFIDKLENGTIQEGVLGQATMGPAVMLSLFNDLQNPLFQKTKFDATQFLEGVGPALENFHNIGGALENQLQTIMKKAGLEKDETKSKDDKEEEASKEKDEGSAEGIEINIGPEGKIDERDTILSAVKLFGSNDQTKQAEAILEQDWSKEAEKDPDSEAGQLSRMVTKELFHMHEMNAKTAFLLQNQIKSITFQEGSCQVNNVALLSARAFAFAKKENDDDTSDGEKEDSSTPQYEMIDYDEEDEEALSKASVAAQLEVLYDVTQEFIVEKSAMAKMSSSNSSDKETDGDSESAKEAAAESESSEPETESRKTTIVSVATLEGWLKGGPDNELRWKLALHRPAFEFPGIEHSY